MFQDVFKLQLLIILLVALLFTILRWDQVKDGAAEQFARCEPAGVCKESCFENETMHSRPDCRREGLICCIPRAGEEPRDHQPSLTEDILSTD